MAAPVLPTSIANLKLWCSADRGVSGLGSSGTWTDQSGNHNDLVQSTSGKRPVFIADAGDNRPAVHFDGVDDCFAVIPSLITGAGSPFTIILNARVDPGFGTNAYPVSIGGGSTGGGGFANLSVHLNDSTGQALIEISKDDGSATSATARAGSTADFSMLCIREAAVSPTSFVPTNLSGLVGWYKGGVGITLNSGHVQTWADQSGGGHDLSQLTAANQPLPITSALNGHDTVRFDGSNDFMSATFTLPVLCTHFIVYKLPSPTAPAGHDIILDGINTATCLLAEDTSNTYLYNGAVLNASPPGPLNTSSFGYMTAVNNAGSSLLRNNGVQVAAGTDGAGATAPGGITLAALAGGSRSSGVEVAEVVVYNRALTPSEVLQVEQYLAERYFGVPAVFELRGGVDTSDATALTPGRDTTKTSGASLLVGAKGSGYPTFAGSLFFTGMIRDLLVFDREITPTEFAQVLAYLTSKDAVAPTATNFSPAANSTITATTTLSFDLTDNFGKIADGTVYLTWAGGSEVIFDGQVFTANYSGSLASITNGATLSFSRIARWPAASITLNIHMVDADGNVLRTTASFTVSNPPTPPTTTLVSPAAGSPLQTDSSVVLDVTDDSGAVPIVVVTALYPDGSNDVIFDGNNFASKYAASSRVAVTNGWRFTLKASKGWPAAPTIRVLPVDGSGAEG